MTGTSRPLPLLLCRGAPHSEQRVVRACSRVTYRRRRREHALAHAPEPVLAYPLVGPEETRRRLTGRGQRGRALGVVGVQGAGSVVWTEGVQGIGKGFIIWTEGNGSFGFGFMVEGILDFKKVFRFDSPQI